MITLTSPPSVNSVLGGSAPITYPKLVLSPFTLDPFNLAQGVQSTVRLTSPANSTQQAITGSLVINASTGVLRIEVPQLDFYRQVQLSGAQLTSVNTIITNAQNALEAGLVSLGIVAGTQSSGA
jgi:hypothetical protein